MTLDVPYFSQLDNVSGQGYRECFSSTCGMIAAFHNKVESDDEYNRVRARYGNTTDYLAHIHALEALGLNPVYRQDGSLRDIQSIVNIEGSPVAVGWLHRGHISCPTGGGHWSVIVGVSNISTCHHDPRGEARLVSGGHIDYRNGNSVVYSHVNWLPRWIVEGNGTGWYLYCLT
jgi:hypothetical protein